MGIENALRVSRRARGVAEAAGGALVEASPNRFRRGSSNQGLEGFDAGEGRRWEMRLIRHENDSLDRWTLRLESFQQRQERQIGEQNPVLRVVDDVDELIGKQPGIQGMAECADPYHAIPGLDMSRRVPREGGDPIAGLHATRQKGVREPFGSVVDF